MNYPSFARPLLGATGFSLDVTGRRRNLLLSSCDRLFKGSSHAGNVTIQLEGVRLELNLLNASERVLNYAPHNLLRRYRQSDLFWLLSRVSGSGGLFLDIGANLGIFSFLARTLGLEAILFEPEPIHYAFLQRNAAAIGHAYPYALSDECATLDFFLGSEQNPGSFSLVSARTDLRDQKVISVDVSTFDEVAKTSQIDLSSIRLIKIDVEGNEERTLRGMRGYFSRPDSAPIWCEVRGPTSGRCNNSVVAVATYLEDFGFKPFQRANRHLVPYRIGIDHAPQVFDLLFAVPSRHGILLDS